jgi:Fe-S-cluster containining protein
MREKLLELYRRLYRETDDISLGCADYGCGRICEEGPDEFSLCSPGERWMPWEFYLLPWEHELMAEAMDEEETRFQVVNIGGMPIATVKFNDYCPYYQVGSGYCKIFDERPIICRSFPLWPRLRLAPPAVDFDRIELCPANISGEFIARYRRVYLELLKEIPAVYWKFFNVTGEGSTVALSSNHKSRWYERFKEKK